MNSEQISAEAPARESRPLRLNTWGPRRRAGIASVYDDERYPSISQVCRHLQLTLIEVSGDGEPTQVALGERRILGDPDALRRRVTPFFSTIDALDFFCQRNLNSYLGIDPAAELPRRWFWEQHSSGGFAGGGGDVFGEHSLRLRARGGDLY